MWALIYSNDVYGLVNVVIKQRDRYLEVLHMIIIVVIMQSSILISLGFAHFMMAVSQDL